MPKYHKFAKKEYTDWTSLNIQELKILYHFFGYDNGVCDIVQKRLNDLRSKEAGLFKKKLIQTRARRPELTETEIKRWKNKSTDNLLKEYAIDHDEFEGFFKLIITLHIACLKIEAKEVKNNKTANQIILRNGEKLEQDTENEHIFHYRFPYHTQKIYLLAGDKIEIKVADIKSKATVIDKSDNSITLSINSDIDGVTKKVILYPDLSYLLLQYVRVYKKLLDEEQNLIDERRFLDCHGIISSNEDNFFDYNFDCQRKKIQIEQGSLNKEQWDAVEAANENGLFYLWGPPGTGKTYTLARIVLNFYLQGKTIVIISNTNLAVDTLLYAICELLTNLNDADFDDGSVGRLGTIRDENLREKYSDFIEQDKVIERLEKKYRDQIKKLQPILASHKDYYKTYKEISQRFDKIKILTESINYMSIMLQNLEREKPCLDKILHILQQKYKKYSGKTNYLENHGIILSILSSPFRLWLNWAIHWVCNQIKDVKSTQALIEDRISLLKNKITDNEKNIDYERKNTAAMTPETAIEEVKFFEKSIADLSNKIKSLDSKIINLPNNIPLNYKIIAATATYVCQNIYLFRHNDVVVMDEAPMIPFSLASLAAGLARYHVVIAGDFRQLSAIIQSRSIAVTKWIGRDIFDHAGIVSAINDGGGDLSSDYVMLIRQYRMTQEICNLPNKLFYFNRLITEKNTSKKNSTIYPELIHDSWTLMDTSSMMPMTVRTRTSRYNEVHVSIVVCLVAYLVKNSMQEKNIGVITSFNKQAELMSTSLQKNGYHDVAVGTVHTFQGGERDILLFDITDSCGVDSISSFFTATKPSQDGAKLLNVAMTRTKNRFIVIANKDFLSSKLKPRTYTYKLLAHIKSHGTIHNFQTLISQKKLSDLNIQFFDKKNLDQAINTNSFADSGIVVTSEFTKDAISFSDKKNTPLIDGKELHSQIRKAQQTVPPGIINNEFAVKKDPLCPRCESSMVKRIAKKGAKAGQQFWGCSRFPRCRSTLSISG